MAKVLINRDALCATLDDGYHYELFIRHDLIAKRADTILVCVQPDVWDDDLWHLYDTYGSLIVPCCERIQHDGVDYFIGSNLKLYSVGSIAA